MHLHQDIPSPLPTTPTLPTATTIPTPSSTPLPLYFAYGSNLSPTQMKLRCTQNPSLSSHPLAIALLPSWRWLICQFGYANVLPPPHLRVNAQVTDSEAAAAVPVSGADDAVYGVLYEMDEADEYILDGYEGVDHQARESEQTGRVSAEVRPSEQGSGLYNKWYVGARVVRWLDEGYRARKGSGEEVKVLVYVDEERVRLGPPKEEYIPRMNRAIAEAVGLGFPGSWADEVMRPVIPLN